MLGATMNLVGKSELLLCKADTKKTTYFSTDIIGKQFKH